MGQAGVNGCTRGVSRFFPQKDRGYEVGLTGISNEILSQAEIPEMFQRSESVRAGVLRSRALCLCQSQRRGGTIDSKTLQGAPNTTTQYQRSSLLAEHTKIRTHEDDLFD